MGYMTWLADVLRGAGCKVVELEGWQSRGRGPMGTVRGVLDHHTGAGGKDALIKLITEGRTDLAGPLSQLFLDDDGTFYVIAAGRCNHAGAGAWHGVTNGNSELIGIEARNAGDGKDVWEAAQMDAYARGVAAILKHIGADSVMVAGHKEYATPRGRKIDPSFDMVAFREHVEAIMLGGAIAASPVATVDPARAMLRKGDQGQDVRTLQAKLNDAIRADLPIDGGFGPRTEAAVKNFQAAKGLLADGMVGPKTWVALGV